MEKSKVLIIVGLIVIGIVVLLLVNYNKVNENKTNTTIGKSNISTENVEVNNTKVDEEESNSKVETETRSEDKEVENDKTENIVEETEFDINGKYEDHSETADYYHRSDLVVKNSTKDSIEFELNTAHGRDVDHVNIGDLTGKATKIDVPESMVIPESTQYAYEFKEETDGKTNKIIFVYTAHKESEYINIEEEYATENNPYAGNNVWFKGEYQIKSGVEESNSNVKADDEEKSDLDINGTYEDHSETADYYHRSDLVVKNSTKDSIEFELNTAHGRDVDHVNIGDLTGKATKIDVPESMVIPESTQYAYEFKEETDGKTNKIIFVYTAHKESEYINIEEEYATENNPYAGNNVWFKGEYELKK